MDKSETNLKRLGLLGGTFDPIHNAHIRIALYAKKEHNLDKVYFITARIPPPVNEKKEPLFNAEIRHSLVEQALKEYQSKGLEACRIELDREGVSYTYKTIETFKKLLPDTKLFWILGEDAYKNFESWDHHEYILENATLIVCPRDPDDISSSEIRKILSNSDIDQCDDLIPPTLKSRLYQYYSHS